MAILFIIATPIGNLEDLSFRALRVLGEVDFILCEDTRVTKKLLSHYKITTPTISYHQHSGFKKVEHILDLLANNKNLALVSDAGTPGISDPGGKLVQAVIEKFDDVVKIESVPGPSAVIAALSISGIPADKFLFLGFPPHKKGRQTFLKKILESEWTVVVYESKHRIIRFLEELREMALKHENTKTQKHPEQLTSLVYGAGKNTKTCLQSVIICRELSKMHETVYRGIWKILLKKLRKIKTRGKGSLWLLFPLTPSPSPTTAVEGEGQGEGKENKKSG